MNQSTVIVSAILVAFLAFVTTRGELPAYLGVFVGGMSPEAAPSAAPATSGNAALDAIGGAVSRSPYGMIYNGAGAIRNWMFGF